MSTGERREAVSTEDGSARFVNLVPGPLSARGRADGLPALGARGHRGQRPDHASHRRHAGARQPLRDADGHRPVAAAADAERVGRHDRRRPRRAGDAAERPQRAQPHLAGAVGGAAGRRRRQSDRQERLRGRQLPDWRRHGQPERVVLRRRDGAGHRLRQHRGADAESRLGRGVQRPDQQQQRRVRPLHRRRGQHGLALGHQRLPRQPVRVPPQPGTQLQHLLRREGRAGEAALHPEQLRRHDRRAGQARQAVLLLELRGLPQRGRHPAAPHRADAGDARRRLLGLPQPDHRGGRADLRPVDAVRHQQPRQRGLQRRLRHGAEPPAVPRQPDSGQPHQPDRPLVAGLPDLCRPDRVGPVAQQQLRDERPDRRQQQPVQLPRRLQREPERPHDRPLHPTGIDQRPGRPLRQRTVERRSVFARALHHHPGDAGQHLDHQLDHGVRRPLRVPALGLRPRAGQPRHQPHAAVRVRADAVRRDLRAQRHPGDGDDSEHRGHQQQHHQHRPDLRRRPHLHVHADADQDQGRPHDQGGRQLAARRGQLLPEQQPRRHVRLHQRADGPRRHQPRQHGRRVRGVPARAAHRRHLPGLELHLRPLATTRPTSPRTPGR